MTKDFEQLFEKFLQDDLSPDELKIFLATVKQQNNAATIRELLTKKLESTLRQAQGDKSVQDMDAKFQQMLQKAEWIKSNEDTNKVIELSPKTKFFSIRRIAAAASIIVILGVGVYFIFLNKTGKQTEIVKTDLPNDLIAPETNRAMITLANGQKVFLDSVSNGQLAMQGNVKLVKLANGQIAYEIVSGELLTEMKYNTLENPRGSKVIDMTLADGSRVWLNAGSSVTYPVRFINNERKVSITGEAYFEVAHSTTMPFKVSKSDMEVTVLGTHFNVNAYDDEADIKVTLLEGSVNVKSESSVLKLKPGQQAIVISASSGSREKLTINNDVDLEEVMAWKNGYFKFEDVDIKSLMREIARWYDVEIEYQGNIPNRTFKGEIDRDVPASEVLKILEYAGIHFRIEGKKIVVIP